MTTIASNKCRGALAAALLAAAPAFAQLVQNPLARHAAEDPQNLLEGSWNGANLENRSACAAAQNDGFHGTYGEFVVGFDRPAGVMSIDETAITGLRCNYLGHYTEDRFRPQWSGTYSCTDGKQGSFQMQHLLATANEMSVRLAIQLSGSETCSVDAILGGSRF